MCSCAVLSPKGKSSPKQPCWSRPAALRHTRNQELRASRRRRPPPVLFLHSLSRSHCFSWFSARAANRQRKHQMQPKACDGQGETLVLMVLHFLLKLSIISALGLWSFNCCSSLLIVQPSFNAFMSPLATSFDVNGCGDNGYLSV